MDQRDGHTVLEEAHEADRMPAPMSVMLPPRHAPSDSAHHTGMMASWRISSAAVCVASAPAGARSLATTFSSAAMVATNGMLSMIPEAKAENHSTTTVSAAMLPCVTPPRRP